jgi:hypothetical protein
MAASPMGGGMSPKFKTLPNRSTAFSERDAPHGRSRGEIHWACRRGARCGSGARGDSPLGAYVLAVARQHLGSLDKVTRIVRLGVSVATSGDVRDQPKVADAASELLQEIFGKTRALAAWCTASQAFRSAPRSSWKSFSRWRCKGGRTRFGHLASSSKCFSTMAENS